MVRPLVYVYLLSGILFLLQYFYTLVNMFSNIKSKNKNENMLKLKMARKANKTRSELVKKTACCTNERHVCGSGRFRKVNCNNSEKVCKLPLDYSATFESI